jgi:hypothetical protein
VNPFTERSRITDPARFTGRWREVGMVFERLETRRPVMVTGAPGSGKSSLLTHVAQSAATVLELPDLAAFYLDLSLLPDAATAYRLVIRELGGRGDGVAELETWLTRFRRTTLLCLDEAGAAVAAGWGAELLEPLARLARRSVPIDPDGDSPRGPGLFDLMIVAAAGQAAPPLSEPFAGVRLGALSASEVRLLTEAYLDESEVAFSGAELRELAALSVGHPAYLQRAAYQLFEAKTRRAAGQPGHDWRAAYLAEARERPVPGAPLPDEVFRGEGEAAGAEAAYGEPAAEQRPGLPPSVRLEGPGPLLAAVAPLLAALVTLQASGSWAAALLVLAAGYGVAALALRGR